MRFVFLFFFGGTTKHVRLASMAYFVLKKRGDYVPIGKMSVTGSLNNKKR